MGSLWWPLGTGPWIEKEKRNLSFTNKCLLNTYHMSGPVLGAGDILMNKPSPWPHELDSSGGKQIKYKYVNIWHVGWE